MPIAPSPRAETVGPVRPRFRVFMGSTVRRSPRGRERSAYRGSAAPWMRRAGSGQDGFMQRDELADFLRRRREAIRPAEVGLADGPRRRTAGLRREEVAMLAGMSSDYVVRLEQGRSSQPSTQLLGALARALRLSDDERDHLFHLAEIGRAHV